VEANGQSGAGSVLIERDGEIAQIGKTIDRAGKGSGGMLLLEAAAGLGKSSLLATAVAEASSRGMEVVQASAPALGGEVPFMVCQHLFEAALTEADDPEREELLSGAAGSPPAAPAAVGPGTGRSWRSRR
jgi:hypothetical protein